jgi:hypothetical protein
MSGMATALTAIMIAIGACTDTHSAPGLSARRECGGSTPHAFGGHHALTPALRLKGGRERAVTAHDGKSKPAERSLPDVSEPMRAKIVKHRQMRKSKVPEDPAVAQKKLERKKLHEQRRGRRDEQRASSKKQKVQDRKRRPFMRDRDGGRKVRKQDSNDVSSAAAQESDKFARQAVSQSKKSEAAAGQPMMEHDGDRDASKKLVTRLAVAMPARERILRPFWDPQAKGRDIASASPLQRRKARERLLQVLVAVQEEHQHNSSASGRAHDEVLYAMRRLVRGLASDEAGDGFSEALVVILKTFGPVNQKSQEQTPGSFGGGDREANERAGVGGSRLAMGNRGHDADVGNLFSAADVFAIMDEHLDDSKCAGSAKERARCAHGKMRAIQALWLADAGMSIRSDEIAGAEAEARGRQREGERKGGARRDAASKISGGAAAASPRMRGGTCVGYLQGNATATVEAVLRLLPAAAAYGWQKQATVEVLPLMTELLQTLPRSLLECDVVPAFRRFLSGTLLDAGSLVEVAGGVGRAESLSSRPKSSLEPSLLHIVLSLEALGLQVRGGVKLSIKKIERMRPNFRATARQISNPKP